MTDTTASMPPPDDTRLRRDPSEQPERPGTIPWELLSASDYRSAIEDLGSWLAWLVPAYRIPPSAIPPCWFLHTGLIEELGHLWTGWRVTRHPESGLGMVGLEWDNHRERATGRLRELVATAGCNGTTHSGKPGPALNREDNLWTAALRNETSTRTTRSAERAMRRAAETILLQAEQRNELALRILDDIAADPAFPTAVEISDATWSLENMTRVSASDALVGGRAARTYVESEGNLATQTLRLAAARECLLDRITTISSASQLAEAMERWISSVADAIPAEQSIRRVSATYAGKSATANYSEGSKQPHKRIAEFLPSASTGQTTNLR